MNTSAFCVICNGIFLHYWNQSWFILVWWPDLRNSVLSQFTIELLLFPQGCIASDAAVWQPDNAGLASRPDSLAGWQFPLHTLRCPMAQHGLQESCNATCKAKAHGIQQRRTGTADSSSLSSPGLPGIQHRGLNQVWVNTMFWTNSRPVKEKQSKGVFPFRYL